MWTELYVEPAGLLRARSALDRLVAAGETVQATVFPAIVHDFHRAEQRRFDRQGPGWAELSPTTLAIRHRKGIDHDRILEQTGRLKAALTGQSGELQVIYDGDDLVIGLGVEYGKYHHIGPRRIRVFGGAQATLPQRKLFEVSQGDALRWSRLIARGLRITPAETIIDLDAL